MKGPLSADRLFFISSASFVISFVIYSVMNYVWPIPVETIVAASTDTSNALGMISWVLSIAGAVTFVLGLVARNK